MFDGFIKKIKSIFGPKVPHKEVTIQRCPFCGSPNITAFSVLANFVQVINGTEQARYVQSATCLDCGKKFVLEEGAQINLDQKGD